MSKFKILSGNSRTPGFVSFISAVPIVYIQCAQFWRFSARVALLEGLVAPKKSYGAFFNPLKPLYFNNSALKTENHIFCGAF